MSKGKEEIIRNLVDQMTIEEKAGQLLVVDFTGTTMAPHTYKVINDLNVAGIRVQTNIRYKNRYEFENNPDQTKMEARSYRQPVGGCKDFSYNSPAPHTTPKQYALILNELKGMAMKRRVPVPLHVTLDQEGAGYDNYICGDPLLFPTPMGLAATNDEDVVYKAVYAMGKQLKDAGFDCLQNLVVDVNTNPKNPEIGIRAFSDDPEKVSRFSTVYLRALKAAGIIAVAKHFPGRGESESDAHKDLPQVTLSREEMLEKHVSPYVALIKEGLPGVMTAHTIYPSFEKEEIPATVSRDIVTGLLREELGFGGIITTDNILMAGVIKKYDVSEACIRAIMAGTTLILLRDETPLVGEVYEGIVEAIKSGELSEDIVDQAILRNLAVKYDYGLFKNGGVVDASKAHLIQEDPEARKAEYEAAAKSVCLLRDRQNILPLTEDTRAMLIEQPGGSQYNCNGFYCHPGNFWESLLKRSQNAICVEIDGTKEPGEEEIARIERRLDECDVIIATDWEVHREHKLATRMLLDLQKKGKKLIVVTNSPYNGIPEEFETVLITFTDAPQSLEAASDIIYGHQQAQGTLPIGLYD